MISLCFVFDKASNGSAIVEGINSIGKIIVCQTLLLCSLVDYFHHPVLQRSTLLGKVLRAAADCCVPTALAGALVEEKETTHWTLLFSELSIALPTGN
jgi:hypothetical protein